ncbi:hypothetical protein Tco_0662788 [Tanacetum coccineum]
MSSYNQRECVGCGQPFDDFYCYLCTCQQCGVNLINGICLNCTYGDGKPVTCCGCEGPLNGGFCSFCASRAGNSFAYDPNPNSFDDSQNLSDYPPQPQYQTYSCELCGNDAHYGYDCPPQVSFISNPDPCYNQNYDEFPQTLPTSDGVYDLPVYDDFPKSHLVTFSNPLFNIDDDYTSSDDESFSEEDVPTENFKIFSNLLFDLDEEIVSIEVNLIQNEVLLSPLRMVTPSWKNLKQTPELETFKFDIEEKNSGSTTIHADISLPDLECVYFKSEPDLGDLTSIDPGIRENVSSTTNVNLPFEDDQSPLFAYVVWIFLSFLTYPVAPPYLLSSGNEDTIFDPGISIYHSFMPGVSHRSGTFMKFNVYPNHLNESLMEILSSTCFPMDQ